MKATGMVTIAVNNLDDLYTLHNMGIIFPKGTLLLFSIKKNTFVINRHKSGSYWADFEVIAEHDGSKYNVGGLQHWESNLVNPYFVQNKFSFTGGTD